MNGLPVPICRIVYGYLYDVVLNQLTQVYGRTMRLSMVPNSVVCKRVNNDSKHGSESRRWRLPLSSLEGPNERTNLGFIASWELMLILSGTVITYDYRCLN